MARWLNVLALMLLIAQLTSASSVAEEQKTPAETLILVPGALSRMESYGANGLLAAVFAAISRSHRVALELFGAPDQAKQIPNGNAR